MFVAQQMEWPSSQCFALIDKYKENSVLWDPKDGNYYNKQAKHEAWESIAAELNIPSSECKKKMLSLNASLRREKGKIINRSKDGLEFRSSWFAFDRLAFLLERKTPSKNFSNSNDDVEEIAIEDLSFIKEETEESNDLNDYFLENASKDANDADILSTNNRLEDHEVDSRKIYQRLTKKRKIDNRPFLNSSTKVDGVCFSFGRYIAHKLLLYPHMTRCAVEHAINNILYKADMGELENRSSSSKNKYQEFSTSYQEPNYHSQSENMDDSE